MTRDATVATITMTTINTTILDDAKDTNVETVTTTIGQTTNRLTTIDDSPTIIKTIGGINRRFKNSIEYHLGCYEQFDEQTNLLNRNAID